MTCLYASLLSKWYGDGHLELLFSVRGLWCFPSLWQGLLWCFGNLRLAESCSSRRDSTRDVEDTGQSSLTCLVKVALRSEAVPLDWQTGMVVAVKKNGWGGQSVFSSFRGITILSPPRKSQCQGSGGRSLKKNALGSKSIQNQALPRPWVHGPGLSQLGGG